MILLTLMKYHCPIFSEPWSSYFDSRTPKVFRHKFYLCLFMPLAYSFLFFFFVAQTDDIVASAKAVGGKIIGG